MPEVAAVDGMVFANSILDDGLYLFCFGYDPSGFSIRRFRIVAGERLDQVSARRGRPLLLGRQAAERLHRKVGDVLYIGQVPFRVVGLYETGSSPEDSAAVVSLENAQTLTLQPRRVTVLYVKLRDPALADAFHARMARRFPDLTAIASEDFLGGLAGMGLGVGLALLARGPVPGSVHGLSIFPPASSSGHWSQ